MKLRLLRSFRWRIALLTAGISGSVVVGSVLWVYGSIQENSRRRVDDQIARFANPLFGRPGQIDWIRAEADLAQTTGLEAEAWPVLLVQDFEGNPLHQSAPWPAGLTPEIVRSHRIEPPQRGPGEGPPPERPLPPRRPGPPEGRPRDGQGPRFGPNGRPPFDDRRGPPPMDDRRGPPPIGPPSFFTWQADGVEWRIGVFATPRHTLALGLNYDFYNARMSQVRAALIAALALGLACIAAGGYFVASRALRPVRLLGDTAQRVTARGLHERIPTGVEDVEFQQVIEIFNGMLERLERSFYQATRFSADASHELKTPLTILQGMLEEGVQQAPAGSREQERYGELLEEVQRLKAITQKLLLLSRADAGQLQIDRQPVDLSVIVEDVCDDIAALAPGLRVKSEIPPSVLVSGDPILLRQVVQNLTNNAMQYNAPPGRVWVLLRPRAGMAHLTVINSSIDLTPDQRARLFERFYRVDAARSREQGGSGLGLSLAREIALAHGGTLELIRSEPGTTAFALSLPLRP
jgi:signal transduction histidine kinase